MLSSPLRVVQQTLLLVVSPLAPKSQPWQRLGSSQPTPRSLTMTVFFFVSFCAAHTTFLVLLLLGPDLVHLQMFLLRTAHFLATLATALEQTTLA